MKKRVMVIVVAAAVLVASFAFWLAQHRPAQWYPFVGGFWGDTYVASPFGFTSNVREDNPLWQTLPGFNRALARTTYAMTRGEPAADIAWLMSAAEWPDRVDLGAGMNPNAAESPVSRTLTEAGLVFDRVSRENLLHARAADDLLQVGHMRYRALLVEDLAVTSPELLQTLETVIKEGVPVIWVGKWPERAYGWRDHEQRDQSVARLRKVLEPQVKQVASTDEIIPLLDSLHIRPFWCEQLAIHPGLRSQRRSSAQTEFALLFNDSDKPLTIALPNAVLSRAARLLDPESGAIQALHADANTLTIPPRRFRILQAGKLSTDWDTAQWQAPGSQYRPYVRWWWPGNAVSVDQLKKELHAMQGAGFGGVEIQTLTFGMSKSYLQNHAADIYAVGSDAWLDKVRAVINEGHQLGMRVDLTLGSGWPTGAPFMTAHPEQQLLKAEQSMQEGEELTALPTVEEPLYAKVTRHLVYDSMGPFDEKAQRVAVIAARMDSDGALVEFVDVSAQVQDSLLHWRVPQGRWKLIAFYQNATHHNVLAAAFPGAELHTPHHVNVVDHLDQDGIQEYMDKLVQPWLKRLQPELPDAFFVDSFELIGDLPWSSRFRAAFLAQHGYDIVPQLPLVFRKHGESKYFNMIIAPAPAYVSHNHMGERIREDYEATREALFRDSYVQPLQQGLSRQRIPLRLQAHGGFGDYLDNYQIADIPESEALFAGGSFEFLKLAASAGHIAGRPVISSESFIAVSLDPQRLALDDFYYLAGNAYAAGINRLMFHGYAYQLEME